MSKIYTNNLINEKSPYLLQHAHNPVNWYPWCKATFAEAKEKDKPIFLSIGYSTCHWCHVMAHESFEDEETAKIINKHYIAVKVDREERPDVDAVYMEICMAMNKNGGWPLTVIMTPEQKPFFAATYLPKKSRFGLQGLDDLLTKIANAWHDDKEKLLDSADSISDLMKELSRNSDNPDEPTEELLEKGTEQLLRSYDSINGGFGSIPKFPTPHNIVFLIRQYEHSRDERLINATVKTLDQMYRGGIFDHIGGGFSRYSTDNKWLVPHFEKMLYDNAMLLYAYSEGYRFTQKKLYKTVCNKVIEYVFKEMTHDKGGFFSAQDADSDRLEGKYYVFTPDEIISNEKGNAFCDAYDITPKGNFEGKSIPNLLKNESYETAHQNRENETNILYQYRLKRTALFKDDKVLVSWSSLMILAMTRAHRIFGYETCLQAAEKAFMFIMENMINKDGRLTVSWRLDKAGGEGKLCDYAFFIWAALELYDTTLKTSYLETASNMAIMMINRFFDHVNGGFYIYADDDECLYTRPKETYDGAMPSGNSVASLVCERLAQITLDDKFRNIVNKQFGYIAGCLKNYPAGHTFALLALSEFFRPRDNLICVTNEQNTEKSVLLFLAGRGIKHINVIIKTPENSASLSKTAPYTGNYQIPHEGTMYYLCRDYTCKPPCDSLEELFL